MASHNTHKPPLKTTFQNEVVLGTTYTLDENGQRMHIQSAPQVSMGDTVMGFLEKVLSYFKGDYEKGEILSSRNPFNEDTYVDPAEEPDPLAGDMVKTVYLPPAFNAVSGNNFQALAKDQIATLLKTAGVEEYLNGNKNAQEVIQNLKGVWDNFHPEAPNKVPFSGQDAQSMEDALEKAKADYQKNHDLGKALNFMPGGTAM